jgi:transcriptional regulator with XRE-family HTH domain
VHAHCGIWQTETVRAAVDSQNLGAIVRALREANHLTLAELAHRCGYSAASLSRMERGKQPIGDVRVLRSIAAALAVPPALLGLADTALSSVVSSAIEVTRGPKVGRITVSPAEEDWVRRRTFLLVTGGAVASGLAGGGTVDGVDPARLLTECLGSALLTPSGRAGSASLSDLRRAALLARHEFTACDYIPLASRLPALLAAAETTAALAPEPAAHQVLADTYTVITDALIKLEASGLEWMSADRGLHAARLSDDPLTIARAQRLVAAVARRAGYLQHAQDLTLDATSHLDLSGARPAPEHLAMFGILHCTASYAAAQAGDRERAAELLAEAARAAQRLSEGTAAYRTVMANLVSYRVSAAHSLGDDAMAIAQARSVPLGVIPTTERRARVLVDTARCWARLDRPDQAFTTLLAAERIAPGEVRTRTAVRQLVTDLMASPRRASMPGLPALAARVHAMI